MWFMILAQNHLLQSNGNKTKFMKLRFLHFFLCLGLSLLFGSRSYGQKLRTHTIRTGDTPSLITEVYEVTLDDLMALNKDLDDQFVAGKIILIPETIRLKNPIKVPKRVLDHLKKHRVKKGETVFGISSKYEISEAVLRSFNTELINQSLKRGMKLQIPIYRTDFVMSYLGNALKSHVVQPQEGKWGISQKFGISITQLEMINPGIPEVLQEGMRLNVPNQDPINLEVEDINFFYYEVPAKIGFYSLEKTLGFTQAEIEKWNPVVKEKGLLAGMTLRLPRRELEKKVESKNDIAVAISSKEFSDLSVKKLALIMPFQLDKYKLNDSSELTDALSNLSRLSLSLEYYTGMLMALEETKSLGLSVNFDVFDSANDLTTLNKVLNSKYFGNYDVVVGPVGANLFDQTAEELNKLSVPCIAPLTIPSVLRTNVFQSIPSDLQLKEVIIKQVKGDDTVDKIVIVSDQSNRGVTTNLKEHFPSAQVVYSRLSKDGSDSFFILLDDLKRKLIAGHNLVFLETENVGFVANVASVLNGLITEKVTITLATTHFNNAFENENFTSSYRSNLKFRYPSINRPLDMNENENFISKYQETYGVFPSRYAIRAYDLTLDLLYRLGMYSNIEESIGNPTGAKLLENNFDYQNMPNGGYLNLSCFVVAYDNYEVKLLTQ